MLTIKDFKKGDTVFSVTMNIGRLKEPDIIEHKHYFQYMYYYYNYCVHNYNKLKYCSE